MPSAMNIPRMKEKLLFGASSLFCVCFSFINFAPIQFTGSTDVGPDLLSPQHYL